MLERLPNETNIGYHKRLVYGKLLDKTLSDIDYSELAPFVYGKELAADECRKRMYGSFNTLQIMDEDRINIEDTDALSELDAKLFELQKERQRFFDQRAALTKIIRERSRQEELNCIIKNAIESSQLPPLDICQVNRIEHLDNDLLVSLTDIHYGAQYENYWGSYSPEKCAAMMAEYADRVISIANTHKSDNCVVWMNGDAISGSIHKSIQVTNKENVIEQIKGVSEIIAHFLAKISPYFSKIKFVSVAGNHSRLDKKEDALIDERLDDLIEWWLQARLKHIENIEFDDTGKIDCTMYAIDIRGQTYVGVHGDYDLTEQNIQALRTMVGKQVYAILMGHKHHNKSEVVQGIKTYMAGSFIGMDDYCVSKRIYSKPEQLICVCDKNGVRCSYDIYFQ